MIFLRRILILVALLPHAAFAGAWLQPEGKGLAIMQLTQFGSSEFFDADGELNDQLFYSKWELQPYAEYGLTKKITIGGTAYIQRVEQGGRENIGVGDPEFFARMKLWSNDRHVVSIQPLVKFPSAYRNSGTPRGGSRGTDVELSLQHGMNIHWLGMPGYTDARIGYRKRGRGLGDQIRTDVAVGLNVTDKWQIIPAIRDIYGEDSDAAANFSENGEQDYSLLKSEVTAAYHIDDQRWVHATFFRHVAGLNTGTGTGITLGYAQRF